MGVDHPGLQPTITEWERRMRRIARASIQNASIGRAGIRVYDGGWIRIEDGGLQVTGTASVSGRLEGSGTFDWTGPMNLKGAQSVTGDVTYTGQMTVNGPWDLNGAGDITGNVNLTGNMAVKAGGSITVQGSGGSVVLSSTYGEPRINLGGAQIDGGSSSFTFQAGTTIIYFTNGTIRIGGMPTKMQSQFPGSFPGAVVVDSLGHLYRIIAG